MKITLCGSINFYEEMLVAKKLLESYGHEVKLPPHEVPDENGTMIPVKEYYAKRKAAGDDETWIWDLKAQAITNHFNKVAWSDVILVINCDKNGTCGYIGGNTLMEMGLAFHLKKPIYMIRPIPELSYREEILGMKPVVVEDIKSWAETLPANSCE